MDANQSSLASGGYVPSGWETIGSAIAWVAFRNAVLPDWWSQHFYFGAALWFDDRPEFIIDMLEAEARSPGTLAQDTPHLAKELTSYVRSSREMMGAYRAHQMHLDRADALMAAMHEAMDRGEKPTAAECDAVKQELALADALQDAMERAVNPSPQELATQAQAIAGEMRSRLPELKQDYERIWSASEALRRALARDKLAAFGWRGEREPNEQDGPWVACRERVPPELLRAPTTLTPAGLVPFPRTHDCPDIYRLLFCGILIDAEELLSVWPAPESMVGAPRLPTSERSPIRVGVGGRPPKHDWGPFNREVVARVALDGGNLRRRELMDHMKAWAMEHMATSPDDRTIEKVVAALVERGVIPD